MEKTATKRLLTIREVARAYGLPEYALRGWCKRGEIQHLKSGSRVYLLPGTVEAFLERGAAKP